MKTRMIVGVLVTLSLLSGCANVGRGGVQTSVSRAEAVVSRPDPVALFARWNTALATGNPDAVVANYAPDAILLPTVSNKVRHTPAEIRDYFVHFLAKAPRGTVIERNARVLSPYVMVDSGTYVFDTNAGQVPARYTFVYRQVGNDWLIAEHHSSAMPEKPEQAKAAH